MKWIGRLSGISCCLAVLVIARAEADGPVPSPGGPSYRQPPWVVLPPNCGTPTAPGQYPQGTMPGGTIPTTPAPMEPGAAPNLPTDAFARAPEGGTQPAADVPGVFGDQIGIFGNRVILLPPGVTGPAIQRQFPGFRQVSGNTSILVAPLPYRTGFKITENESAKPVDRIFFNYNYYNNVDRLLNVPGLNQADFHREMIGFEKTYLGGDASVGLRLPFRQLTGDEFVEDRHLDDISLIFKFALVNNRTTGNVLSTGMVLTLPTGDALKIDGQSDINSTVFQPFIGYIYHFGDFYAQGFSSLVVPTDARDVTILFNSIQLGYRLLRNDSPERWLTSVTPVAEFHLNTPLNHRGLFEVPIGFSDSLNFTGGCYFGFRRATLGVSVGTPMMGPRPYDFEVATNLTFSF